MQDVIAIIPVLNPMPKLVQLVQHLKADFASILVVDDGSTTGLEVFDSLSQTPGVTLLRHATNKGKGRALKTAFEKVLSDFPDTIGVVTIDADGQHLAKDVRAVTNALREHPDQAVLGVREFARDIPFRSKFGNLWTIAEFRLLTGVTIRDTQTGLRALPREFLPTALQIEGERYEYELRQLVRLAKAEKPPIQVPITTIYENNNQSSHFRPLRDTFSTQVALLAECFG